jgi:2-methylisocitrate lyase-like PEP mutase family enzyme
MELRTQRDKAEAFRKMHDRSRILVLPNAWDAASARVIETAGARAIGTSSAGVANALGYPDGQGVPRDEMIAAIARIARVVRAPVSADIEAGYARDERELHDSITAFINAGAIGINLEDARHGGAEPLFDADAAVARIRAAREAGEKAGVPLVINARTDVFLLRVGVRESRFEHAIKRANAYRAAGADCLFVPAVHPEMIGSLVKALDGPLNILAGPGMLPVPELAKLGVARVSIGGGPARAAMTTAKEVAEELLGPGTYTSLEGIMSHADANQLFAQQE